ncbi:DUF6417 family protein [Streptomyces jietaisiensis]|uniref:DUF6417 family protein n=1 Tax=Streptomyces griseoaurantiacus TaxID=68213 RepID=A0ABZ1UXW6_9ACTN|nr:DUF6417 family protein [Streptomyces jietaisiensis]
MRSWEKRLAVLEVLHEREQGSQHGWVLDNDVPDSFQQSVESAVREGLAELADRETRAELSAHHGHPIRWAARLTPYGGDARVYARARPVDEPGPEEPASGEQLVKLRPAQMAALRVFISIAGELASPPAAGLAARVRTAGFSRADNRWCLYLTEDQMDSVAYGLYLHMLGGSSAEANRFARDYGVVYRAAPATRQPLPVVIRALSKSAQPARGN